MRKLSVNLRFILSIVIFCLPIVGLVYYLWVGSNETVQFSVKELEGVDHLIDGTNVKEESLKVHFKSLEASVDSSEWKKVEDSWNQYFASLDDGRFDVSKAQSAVKKYTTANEEDRKSGKALLEALTELRFVREAIADTHNIMLDPDSDSYYLMETMVLWLPRIHEIEAEVLYFAGLSKKQELSQKQIYELYHLQQEFISVSDKAILNFDKVAKFDADYYGLLESYQAKYEDYKKQVQAQKESLVKAVDSLINKEQVGEVLSKTILGQFASNGVLLNDVQKEFKVMVSHRVDVLKATMNKRIGVSVFLLALAILFSSYLATTVNQTLGAFGKAVRQLKKHSEESVRVGQSLLSASKDVADAATQQAASIEETSASLEELSSIVKTNADGSKQAQEISGVAASKVESGAKDVRTLQKNMDDISASSKKIEEIMQLIDDIAFQTNLLALNASVEAARAGEHGKGFAVVADAVRSLAQRSANSAKEIGTLIQESMSTIQKGKESADSVAQGMEDILLSMQKVSGLNTEIASGSQEQASGISQIAVTINDLERTTMTTSGVATKASEYSRAALMQAEGLMQIVGQLQSELKGMQANQPEASIQEFKAEDAIAAHLKWKVRLRDFIDGKSAEKLVSANVCKDDQCALGKWIHGPGSEYSQIQSYQNLKIEHTKFHKCAGEVLKQFEGGRRDKAAEMLGAGSNFEQNTEATVDAIRALDNEING